MGSLEVTYPKAKNVRNVHRLDVQTHDTPHWQCQTRQTQALAHTKPRLLPRRHVWRINSQQGAQDAFR